MKKISNLPEGKFLKLFFALWSTAFLIAACCMPDRDTMFTGLWQILSQSSKISSSYFATGGFAAAFLNMGLVGLCCTLLFVVFKGTPNSASTLAVILTIGFGSWGINILNIWPTIFGVMIYCLVKREKFGANVNAMIYSTGIAPLITDLLIRYPHAEVIGFNWLGLGIALVVGFLIGFFLPAGLTFSPKVHKGFDLYSAALPVGMTAFFLNATLFKTMGVALPKAPAEIDPSIMQLTNTAATNTFCLILFGLCIIFALILGCKPKDYWQLLTAKEQVPDFTAQYGNAVFLMNVGVFGLFILGYFNLIGATFNGVTFGVMFCMLSTCNSGSHPGNVLPLVGGYAVASLVFGWLSPMLGGTFACQINAQAICVGLSYANGLSPITDKYGWRFGFVASVMHYILVTSVPLLHGSYCLYNGGFTAALICLIAVPQLERLFHTKQERKELRLSHKQRNSAT